MVTIFKDGPLESAGVNLDAESPADLMEFWARYQGGRHAAEIFPARPPRYRVAVAALANYASNKATAMLCRARGDLATAAMYEDIAERIYGDLPGFARW